MLNEQAWGGIVGMVTEAVDGDFVRCRGMCAPICGPPPMVRAAVRTLKKRRMGWLGSFVRHSLRHSRLRFRSST